MTADPLIRATTPDDPVSEVIRMAFGGEGDNVAGLWAEIAGSELVLDNLVAEVDGEVVGHGGLSHAWLDARRELVDVWLLSPLSVVPTRQGAGIGTALVAAALDAARTAGAPLLFLEGDPGYYGPRGFEPASAHGCTPPSVRTPAPAFQVVRFENHQDWMNGQLIYHDVWWRHDLAGLRDPLLVQVEESVR